MPHWFAVPFRIGSAKKIGSYRRQPGTAATTGAHFFALEQRKQQVPTAARGKDPTGGHLVKMTNSAARRNEACSGIFFIIDSKNP